MTMTVTNLTAMINEAKDDLNKDLDGAYSVIKMLHSEFYNIVSSNTVITDLTSANNPYSKVVKILLKVKASEKKTVVIFISENFRDLHLIDQCKNGYERIRDYVASEIAYELKNAHIDCCDEDSEMKMENPIVSYKGFDKNMKCRDFQYNIGETFTHEGEVKQCISGFHACPAPLTTFGYYAPADSQFCVVEQSGDISEGNGKVASSVLTVKAEVNFFDMVKAQIEWVKNNLKKDDEESNTGDYSAASNTGGYSAASNTGGYSTASNTGDNSAASNTGCQSAASNTGCQSAASNTGCQSAASNTGDHSAASNTGGYSAASNTGDYSAASNTGGYSTASNTGGYSAASNTGDNSAASNTGYQSASSNTGDYSAASNTGCQSAASNTGDYSAASNTGCQSAASNTGDYSAASNTGCQSAASVKGEQSVAIVTGCDSKAKASEGSWVVITERNDDYEIINIKTAKSGVDIEPDAYYKLVNGEFVKCDD